MLNYLLCREHHFYKLDGRYPLIGFAEQHDLIFTSFNVGRIFGGETWHDFELYTRIEPSWIYFSSTGKRHLFLKRDVSRQKVAPFLSIVKKQDQVEASVDLYCWHPGLNPKRSLWLGRT